MAQAVRRAIVSGEHLAVQAGTGTGKSLAYLVPAIRHAVERGTTVVVSTATIALQRQLVDRDLPRLAKALKPLLGRAPTFAILKGRRNYLCLNKLHGNGDDVDEGDQLFDPFAISALGRTVKRIHEWSSDTETGDRDELVPGVPESAWRQVSVERARVPGRVALPDRRRLLRREGAGRGRARGRRRHQPRAARDRRARGPSGAARARRGDRRRGARAGRPDHRRGDGGADHRRRHRGGPAVREARRPGRRGPAASRPARACRWCWRTSRRAAGSRCPGPPRACCRRCATRRCRASSRLGGERREDPEGAAGPQGRAGRAGRGRRHRVPPAQRVRRAGRRPAARRRVARRAGPGRGAEPGAAGGAAGRRRAAAGAAVRAQHGDPHVGDADAGRHVRRAGPAVGPAARAGGRGRPPTGHRRATGHGPVQDPDAPRWSGLDVGSPFQHAKSGILYVAKRLPPPGRDGLPPAYLDEIAGLVEAAGGRTLGLVLVDAGRQAGHRGAARPARHSAAVPGRRRDDAAGQAVRRGRGDVAVRHALALAGRRRARARRCRA